MNYIAIAQGLSENRNVFKEILFGANEELFLWKPAPEKWCLLEIVCHMYDEEREDFRARTKHILETPSDPLPSIDPQDWVKERNYIGQHFTTKLNEFLSERERSVAWLQSLAHPKWDNEYEHPTFGSMSAGMLLCNWLAHDYLHIRQITKLKYDYLKLTTHEDLKYAGTW